MEAFILYTLKSSICLAAGYLAYFLLLRKDTFHSFKRFIILGILAASIGIPLVKTGTKPSGLNLPVQKIESTILQQTVPGSSAGQRTSTVPEMESPSHPIRILPLVYFIGAGIQLVILVVALARIIGILRRSEKRRYGNIKLAISSSPVIPFCFGKFIIISQDENEENLKEILLHEKTHIDRKHNLDLIFAELYLLMTWYNPFSWMMRHELKQNHEFEADRNVLRQGVDDASYQLLLLRSAAGERLYRLADTFNQSNLKTRISMMNKRKSNVLWSLKALVFVPMVVLMVQLFAQTRPPMMTPPVGSGHSKYLVVKPENLKLLGFQFDNTGLYYKNTRPGFSDGRMIYMYFTKKVYSACITLHKGEKIGRSAPEKVLEKLPVTNNDFAPVVVTAYTGFRTILMALPDVHDPKFLPVQVNMADLHINDRSDTLVFWFLPTPGLRQVLKGIANTDEYLQPLPPEPERKSKTAK